MCIHIRWNAYSFLWLTYQYQVNPRCFIHYYSSQSYPCDEEYRPAVQLHILRFNHSLGMPVKHVLFCYGQLLNLHETILPSVFHVARCFRSRWRYRHNLDWLLMVIHTLSLYGLVCLNSVDYIVCTIPTSTVQYPCMQWVYHFISYCSFPCNR